MSSSKLVVSSALKALPALFGSVVLARILPFVLNIAVTSYLSPTDAAMANVHFPFIVSTVLYLSREAIRTAAQRIPPITQPGSPSAVAAIQASSNLAWLSVPVGGLIAVLSASAVLGNTSEAAAAELGESYGIAVALVALCAVVELTVEPVAVATKNSLKYSIPATVEAGALTLRALTVYFALASGQGAVYGAPLVIASGQVAYTIATLAGWSVVAVWLFGAPFSTSSHALLPRLSGWRTGLVKEAASLEVQSLLQHTLTDGEKVLAWASADLPVQGAYGVASGLGSMVPRLLFAPAEALATDVFAKFSAAGKGDQGAWELYANVLAVSLRGMGLVGLVFAAFGPPYTRLALSLLYRGSQWAESSAPGLLAGYCVYVAVIGLNGLTEAFKRATASPTEIASNTTALLGLVVLYVIIAVPSVSMLGAAGLIVANTINMAARTAHSLYFIGQYFKKGPAGCWKLSAAFPSFLSVVGAVLAAVLLHVSSWLTNDGLKSLVAGGQHVLTGVTLGMVWVGSLWFTERPWIEAMKRIRGKVSEGKVEVVAGGQSKDGKAKAE